eukprot:2524964-Alexandrium_andersonii.AAC.1
MRQLCSGFQDFGRAEYMCSEPYVISGYVYFARALPAASLASEINGTTHSGFAALPFILRGAFIGTHSDCVAP